MFVASFDQFLQNRLVTNTNAADTFVYLFSHRGAITFPDILPSMGFPDVQMKGDMGRSLLLRWSDVKYCALTASYCDYY